MALTPRGKALRHLSTHRGLTEQPPGSNTDDREWGIRRAQLNCAAGGRWLIGTPWCGEWAFWALQHAGVQHISYRQASVTLIEDDARKGAGPFIDWRAPSEYKRVLRGDLVVLFGRGVHVETVRSFKTSGGRVYVVTDGGNTSAGIAGSQSNGGGSYRRVRPLSDVHGFARVDYPGGLRSSMDRVAMRLMDRDVEPEKANYAREEGSDGLLRRTLAMRNDSAEARALAGKLEDA